jgi:recombination protein RecT
VDSTKIKGAYATIKYLNGSTISEYMTIAQIHVSWSKSKTQQAVHKEFPEMMAKRTVVKRLCNQVVNTTTKDTVLYDTMRIKDIEDTADENEATEELAMSNAYVADCEEVVTPTVEKKKHEVSIDDEDVDLLS